MTKDREFSIIECDHMRQIVCDNDGVYRHLNPDGRLAGECGASSAYRVDAVASGEHNTGTWVGRSRPVAEDRT